MTKINYFLILVCGLTLMGCASTPKTDDYTKHVAANSHIHENIGSPIFYLAAEQAIDVRGEYDSDSSIASGSMMYQGGAGVGGLLAQIATHAVINNSARDSKLSAAQLKANEVLAPIQQTVDEIKLNQLTNSDTSEYSFTTESNDTDYLVYFKPIFFVSQDFKHLSLKNTVWIKKINKSKKRNSKKKIEFLYKNLVSVSSQALSEQEISRLKEDQHYLINHFKSLLDESLIITSRELKGTYLVQSNTTNMFKVARSDKKQYIRGHQVDSINSKLVLKNLRSWLIAVHKTDVSL